QAVVDAAYSASLAASASDANQLAGDTLAFGKVSGPAWLSVSAAGALSGTPSSSDVGTNLFTVRVTDSTARSADATLVVEVVASAPPNYWINAAGGSWAADANWFSGYPASGTGTPADFTRLSLGLHPTVTLDGPRTVGALLFGDAVSGGRSWTLGAGTGGPLTLGVATGSPVVSNSVGVTISVGMAGTQGLRKLGGGTLALGAASTYTGPTAIEAGMLDLGTAGSLAAGTPIEIGAGATLRSGAARTLANSLSGNGTLRSASGNLILTGSNTFSGTLEVTGGYLVLGSLNADNGGPHLKLNGGSLTLNGGFAGQTATLGNLSGTSASSRIDPAYEAPTGIKTVQFTQTEDGSFAGILADASSSRFLSLIKAGPARLTLGGANTYTGPTVVTNGHLRINGSLAAGTTTVASPGTLSGTGTLAGPVVVNGTLAPGGDGPGRLTISNTLTLAATANTTMALAKSGGTFSNSAVAGTTSIAAGGTLTVTASGDALAAGDSFTLFNRTPGGTFAATNLPTLASGLRWQTTDNFQTLSVVLNQQSQTIAAFTPIPGMTYAPGATVGVVTPAASSGLPVAVSVKSGPATLSGNTLTVTGAGLVVLAANQAGNGTYGPAAEVTTSFLVAKAAAMVTLGMLGQTYDGSGRAATATTTPAGLPVVFSYS
ncbi:MAG: autotransporter-associated beta strand repeat-containing protein, partial [Verrucomicrobiota bacterium]